MLARWAQDMQAASRSPRTVSERTRLVERVAKESDTPPHLLEQEHVTAFLASCKVGSRPTYFNHLHAWFTWLVRQGIRDDVPTLKLDRPKVGRKDPHTISTGHMRALVGANMWTRTRTMVLLGAYQGLRASEIAKIRGTDFDLSTGELVVTGKGNVTRVLPLHPLVRAEVGRYGAGWWFPSFTRPGESIHAATVSNTVAEAMGRAEIPGTCHDLRRWYATTMVEAGNDLTTVQRLLGHASVATTQRYISVGKQLRIDAVLSLPDVMSNLPHSAA